MHIMENNRFKVIIVEDVKLELKGTEEIFRHEIPNAEVIGTAMTENEFWELLKVQLPDMVLLDLGLGGSTTIGVEICSSLRKNYPDMKVLIFTGEVLNEKLWVDALNAGADGIILKTGELLTATDVQAVMDGKKLVFNYRKGSVTFWEKLSGGGTLYRIYFSLSSCSFYCRYGWL